MAFPVPTTAARQRSLGFEASNGSDRPVAAGREHALEICKWREGPKQEGNGPRNPDGHVRSILTAWSMQVKKNEKKKIIGPKAIAIPNHESSWWK